MRMDDGEVITMKPGRSELDPEVLRKQARFGCGCLVVVALLILITAAVSPYTDWLWFAHDARHPEVFTTAYMVKGQLFAAAFIPALLLFYFSPSRALKVGMVYLRMPSSKAEVLVTSAIGFIQKHADKVTKLAAFLLALFFALGFQAEWN